MRAAVADHRAQPVVNFCPNPGLRAGEAMVALSNNVATHPAEWSDLPEPSPGGATSGREQWNIVSSTSGPLNVYNVDGRGSVTANLPARRVRAMVRTNIDCMAAFPPAVAGRPVPAGTWVEIQFDIAAHEHGALRLSAPQALTPDDRGWITEVDSGPPGIPITGHVMGDNSGASWLGVPYRSPSVGYPVIKRGGAAPQP